MRQDWRCWARPWSALAVVLALTLPLGPGAADSFDGLLPASPQPADGALQPGLAVNYVFTMVRHVDEVEAAGEGTPGEPIAVVDFQSGTDTVLTSDRNDGVCARISGFIKFDAPGRWLMATQSNDGVRVRLAGAVIIEDPDVHTDQFSANAEINVVEPGWYELAITYFERKNTSTLQLYWQRPGATEFEIVPPAALARPM